MRILSKRQGHGGLAAMVLLLAASLVQAIYPDGHWSYVTKLTEKNFESTIQAEIDAGRTMFAPAWNAVVETYAANKDVSFGDVNLSENPVGRHPPHNPGSGGWPTIRYFNKETGLDGGSYIQKTGGAMCDELGKVETMAAYVEEYGKTSLCDVLSEEMRGCNDKEIKYILKMKNASPEEQAKQLQRLEGFDGESMKPELYVWAKTRIKILEELMHAEPQTTEL